MASKIDISYQDKLLVIVGPTASGKSSLAVKLAKKFDGEIICADSRTIYIGMDIGTAKPSVPEQEDIPHHLLNMVTPDKPFDVATFKKLADKTIIEIQSRGKLPILVGGSGLYVDSIIFDYNFADSFGERDIQNPRHLAKSTAKQKLRLRNNTLVVGLQIEPEELRQRSLERVKKMVANGLIKELRNLSKIYSWDLPAMQAPAYKSFRGVVNGTKKIDEAIQETVLLDMKLAKKQRTWFKRNKSIHYVSDPKKNVEIVTTLLNNS